MDPVVTLASNILLDSFGEIVQKVGDTLMRRGKLRMSGVILYTKLKKMDVRNGLFVLMQNNIVDCEDDVDRSGRVGIIYFININEILRRLYFAKYLLVSEKIFGEMGAESVRYVLLNGRASVNQMAKELQKKYTTEKFEKLARQVESIIKDDYMIKVKDLNLKFLKEEDDESPNKRQKLEEPEQLYTINFAKFIWYIRREECISLVYEKLNAKAGLLFRAVFDLIDSQQHEIKNGVTSSCTYLQIAAFVSRNSGLADVVISDYLDALCADSYQFLSRIDDIGEGTYVINIGKLVNIMRHRIVESLIMERYGSAARRIYRMLESRGPMEQKQIHQLAMIPQKDSREKLYRMTSGGFVQLIEVPKSADRAPQRTIYLWRVDFADSVQHVLKVTYKVVGNMIHRHLHELSQSEKLIEKAANSKQDSNQLSSLEKDQIESLRKVLSRIENSQHRLQEVIMILKEF